MVIMSSAQTFALSVGRLSAAPCTAGVHFTCAAHFAQVAQSFMLGEYFGIHTSPSSAAYALKSQPSNQN